MDQVFQKYTDNYSDTIQRAIRFSGQKHSYFIESKAREICRVTQKYLGQVDKCTILDVGCGVGLIDKYLSQKFKKVYGLDMVYAPLKLASENARNFCCVHYNGRQMPFAENTFDVSFAACAFHHSKPEDWQEIISGMYRVTKPGGLCFIFEHNPYNPLTIKVVKSLEMDKDANLLTMTQSKKVLNQGKFKLLEQQFIFFIPIENKIVQFLENHLGWCPLGAQYFLVGKK